MLSKTKTEIIVQNHRGRMNEEGVFPAQRFAFLRVPDLAGHVIPVNIRLLKEKLHGKMFENDL